MKVLLTIAKAMPHRRGLGEAALDQRAETELGRLAIRGHLEEPHRLAGEAYASRWRQYAATLDGPHWPWRGQGRGESCDGCPEPDRDKFCVCAARRRAWLEVIDVLSMAGNRVVARVAIHDQPCPEAEFRTLHAALGALAVRFGYRK